MRKPRRLVILPLVLTTGLLAGCTGENTQPAGAEAPDQVDSEALLAALEGVSPGLGVEESVDDAKEICAAIDEGKASEEVDELALELFGDSAEGDFTIDDARNAVVVITTDYCGEY